jgi:hypothetical protein
VVGLLLYNYLRYIIDDPNLSIDRLAHHLDQIRLGLVSRDDGNSKLNKKPEFLIEDMNKNAAEIFSKLQLSRYIP